MRRPRPRRRHRRVPVAAAAVVFAISSFSTMALTAANVVPASRADLETRPVGVMELAPAACGGLALTNVIVGTNGTNANNLLLGDDDDNSMEGRNGNDCILGGGGDDAIDGGAGFDVCIGGAGTNTFSRCEQIA